MYTIFISSYDEKVVIGLLKDGKELARCERESRRGHSMLLVPLIDDILKDNNLSVNDLNEVLVVSGPGSFTGVRLGITVAKTLAYTLNIPIRTITSIEAIGASINEDNMIVFIDDSKGKYIGKFEGGKLSLLVYLALEDATSYLNDYDGKVYGKCDFNLDLIYDYSRKLPLVNPHAVKATYIKGIEALNGLRDK